MRNRLEILRIEHPWALLPFIFSEWAGLQAPAPLQDRRGCVYAGLTEGAEACERTLSKRGVEWVLPGTATPARSQLLGRMQASSSWERVYQGGGSILFTRRGTGRG